MDKRDTGHPIVSLDYEVFRCPECGIARRFEYKIVRDDYAGECGHRISASQVIEWARALRNAPRVHPEDPER